MQKLPAPVRKFAPFAGVLLLLVVGYLGYGKVAGGSHEPAAEAGVTPSPLDLEAAAEVKSDRKEDPSSGPVIALGDALVVNLADPGRHTTATVGIALHVDEDTPVVPATADEPERIAEEARARNTVISALSGLTSANLMDADGQDAVRAFLVKRINKLVPSVLVMHLYFTELTVTDPVASAEPVGLTAAKETKSTSDESSDESTDKATTDEAEATSESDEADAGDEAETTDKAEATEADTADDADATSSSKADDSAKAKSTSKAAGK